MKWSWPPRQILAYGNREILRWQKKVYLAAAERGNLQGASRLIFTTAHEQQAAQQNLPWLAPSEVIPLGADCPPYVSREACAATFTNLFPQVSERRCLLFLGRIHPKKGLERGPDKARCLGKHGHDFAGEDFTWQRVARDMVSIYRGMLSE
jgi:glycosyltransferase involved in cell wall biosynthesis